MLELAVDNEKVGPLCRVIVDRINEDLKTQEDLEKAPQVLFKFLKAQWKKCYETAPDDKFKLYLQALERNVDKSNV